MPESKQERERREAIELALETGSVGILNSVGVVVVKQGLTTTKPEGKVVPPKPTKK